jgi:hypothetical protein
MKRTIITLAIGIAIGAAAVAAPALSSSGSSPSGSKARIITARVNDLVEIPTIDLSCFVWWHDPDGHVTGPVFSCGRSSTKVSWNTLVSRRWIKVGNGRYYVYQHARLP